VDKTVPLELLYFLRRQQVIMTAKLYGKTVTELISPLNKSCDLPEASFNQAVGR